MNPTPEQQLAIDSKGSNIIVSAGAGSGKTAVLTERVMRILREGTHVDELLVLTFTKAAADEMKNRIRDAIKEESKINSKLKKELELIDQSYITTFDSYALSVVKKYHYLKNLPHDIGISESSIIEMQSKRIMDEVFNEFYKNPTKDFEKLIYDFCNKNDKSIKELIKKIADKINGYPNKEEYLNTYLDTYTTDTYYNKLYEEYINIMFNKINELKEQYNIVLSLAESNFCNNLIEYYKPLFSTNSYEELKNIIAVLGSLPRTPNNSPEELKNAKNELRKQQDDIKKIILTYGDKETIINNLKEAKTYTIAILDIVNKYIDKLQEYKSNNNLYTFQDIALLSIDILKDNKDVREEIKDSFKEIMIDEYQDTNDVQETFISMIENNNVYMVGDIKQSIYRFRNANPYIFKTKYDNYSNNNGGIKIDLVNNFRSRSEVLNNINDIFKYIMDDELGGADYVKSHQMKFGFELYNKLFKTKHNHDMRLLEYDYDKDSSFDKNEIEIFTIIKDIKDKIDNNYQVYDKKTKELRTIKYSDITIIVNNYDVFDLYKQIFEYHGIPLSLCKKSELTDENNLYIIKNIITYLIKISEEEYDEDFKHAFTSIARSYLYSIDDQEIFNYIKDKNYKNNIIYNTLSPIVKDLNSKDVTTIIEEIITRTNMYEKIIEIGDVDNINNKLSYIIDIAKGINEVGYDIYKFKDHIEKIIDEQFKIEIDDSSDADNAVLMMNIYYSKGLEYPICYFASQFRGFNMQDMNDRFILYKGYGIITPIYKNGIYDLITKEIVKYHYIEEEISEKIRLLYVALTRAREQIIVVLPKSDEEGYNSLVPLAQRKKYNSFLSIYNSIRKKISQYYEEVDLTKLNLTKNYKYGNNEPSDISNSSITFEVNELPPIENILIEEAHYSKTEHKLLTKDIKKNMELGTKMHETLELIDFKNPNYDLIKDNYIKSKVMHFLSNDLLKNIKDSNIYKEYEFVYELENIEYHGIIDLMIEYDNHIDIIDYKLNNITDDNYLKQLNGYKDYINSITNKPIDIYLYSIIGETIEKL